MPRGRREVLGEAEVKEARVLTVVQPLGRDCFQWPRPQRLTTLPRGSIVFEEPGQPQVPALWTVPQIWPALHLWTNGMFLQVEQRPRWQVLVEPRAPSGTRSCRDPPLLSPPSVLLTELVTVVTVINRCNAFAAASWVGRRPSLSQHGQVDRLFNRPLSSILHTPTLLENLERAESRLRDIYRQSRDTTTIFLDLSTAAISGSLL